MQFTGFPAEAFDFYDGLGADNSKAFWADHKADYAKNVRAPLEALAADTAEEFGKAHLYRPYRDLRFSKDKTPYKDHQGMFVESKNGLGWYVQLSASGLMIAGGWYMSDSKQIARFREQIQDGSGPELQKHLDQLAGAGFEIDGDQLKTRPRGVPADHPQLELLRYKSIYASKKWDPAAWMGTAECYTRIVAGWRELTPWLAWQADMVGPGQPPLASRGGKGRTDTA